MPHTCKALLRPAAAPPSKAGTSQTVSLPAYLDRHRLLNVNQVADVLGFSVAHIRRLYRTGKLPKPTVIGGRKVGWPASTILDLVASPKEAA